MIPTSLIYTDNLVPAAGRHPYYIVAPRYTRTSAGIRGLHVLCHWLNMTGQSAFLLVYPAWDGLQVNPDLQTPLLSDAIVRHHYAAGLTPVVVYPEVLAGDPFGAPVRVRWIGNVPGLLGGTTSFDPDELCFAHSSHLAKIVGTSDLLSIPVIDTAVYRPAPVLHRSEICFYAAKYQAVHGLAVRGVPEGAIEITRDGELWPPARIADLFRRSTLFYCFEDTALINEAALCGCPVVMMKNETFTWPIAIDEVGWDGYAWGDGDEEVARARRTVGAAYDNYVRAIPAFFTQLYSFVLITQTRAVRTPYVRPLALPGPASHAVPTARTWRTILGDALLDAETLRSGAPGEQLLWAPALALAGAAGAVTFVAGWGKAERAGIRTAACPATLCVVPPAGAGAIVLEMSGVAPVAEAASWQVLWDGTPLASVEVRDDAATRLRVAVLEPGKPMVLSLAPQQAAPADGDAAGRPSSAGLILSAVLALAAPKPPAADTAADPLRQDLLTPTPAPPTTRNCTAVYENGALAVAAFKPDPSLTFTLDRRWTTRGRALYLWGIYETESDETLQAFVPSAESGGFAESSSSRTPIEAGRHAFVMTLPETDAIEALRLDPLEGPGRIVFTHLELVGAKVADVDKPASLPAQPNFARFAIYNLPVDAALIRSGSAIDDGTWLHIVADQAPPEMIVPLLPPLPPCWGDAVYLTGSAACDVADEMKVGVPDPESGAFDEHRSVGCPLPIGTHRFCIRIPRLDHCTSLRFLPFQRAKSIKVKELQLLCSAV